MKPSITELTVSGFRALRDFSVKGLGRVNLITGRNNTGKSSVLEALRLLFSDAAPAVILNILRYREETVGDIGGELRLDRTEALFQFTGIFTGYPQLGKEIQPIQIDAKDGERSFELTVRMVWLPRELNSEAVREKVGHYSNPTIPGLEIAGLEIPKLDEEEIPALMIKSQNVNRIVPLENFYQYQIRRSAYRSDLGNESQPCIYVSPYGGERTSNLGGLWDNIALSDSESAVVSALQIIDPKIIAVSMVGGQGSRQSRTAIVRSANFPRPVPLRSFGDGMNRLFGIVLSLVNAKGGLLLIDEFENGMHHSVQLDAWRTIFRLAHDLDVQVFATSHSWDAIEAFQKAAAESQEDGGLIRLSRKGDAVIPTLFKEKELAVVTRDRIEVR
ncbi:MAG: AAA family ATPase [Bacilli bacterium]